MFESVWMLLRVKINLWNYFGAKIREISEKQQNRVMYNRTANCLLFSYKNRLIGQFSCGTGSAHCYSALKSQFGPKLHKSGYR